MRGEIESLKEDKARLGVEIQNLKAAFHSSELAKNLAEENAAAEI